VKWVELSPGRYKLVEDDDSRPAVKLKSRIGTPNVKFNPSWGKYEQNYWTPDPDVNSSNDLTDKFLDEREHQLKVNPKAKRWEEGRKKEWARNKPYWVKQQREKGVDI